MLVLQFDNIFEFFPRKIKQSKFPLLPGARSGAGGNGDVVEGAVRVVHGLGHRGSGRQHAEGEGVGVTGARAHLVLDAAVASLLSNALCVPEEGRKIK